jgi:hypothetical protein
MQRSILFFLKVEDGDMNLFEIIEVPGIVFVWIVAGKVCAGDVCDALCVYADVMAGREGCGCFDRHLYANYEFWRRWCGEIFAIEFGHVTPSPR